MVCPEYRLFHRALWQKRPVILRSLLMVVSNGIYLADWMGFMWFIQQYLSGASRSGVSSVSDVYRRCSSGQVFVAVCCSVLQCVAVCCGVLYCVAVCCSLLQSAAMCCSELRYVVLCCSVLQCAAVCHSVPYRVEVCWRGVAVRCSVLHLQCTNVCSSMLQFAAVCCSVAVLQRLGVWVIWCVGV